MARPTAQLQLQLGQLGRGLERPDRPRPADAPVRSDDRIILHFDYDCFYAQVVQKHPPPGMTVADLAGQPVGVTQKSILATCNYEARRLGVRKLMRIADAVRVLPRLVLVDGEDLSPFRDASKALYRLVQQIVPGPVERLGLDELFVDATALVDANAARLETRPPSSWSAHELFLLRDDDRGSGSDAPHGFAFDCTVFSGCIVGAQHTGAHAGLADGLSAARARHMLRLVLGSHLAAHIRSCVARDGGYTSSAGIATNKVLAKLAGKQNKPANQTTILSWPADDGDATVHAFMDALPLRGVPGIGYKTATLLRDHIGKNDKNDSGADEQDGDGGDKTVTVADVRRFPGMSPRRLDAILGRAQATGAAGAALPSGDRVWQLLHGVDTLPVRGGRDVPTQISIEDTYAGPRQGTLRPDAARAVAAELRRLATSLLARMHIDLRSDASTTSTSTGGWAVRPRTLRLTLRPQCPHAAGNRVTETSYHFPRMSRSEPLPAYVLSLTAPHAQTVERLVQGRLVPMFRKLAAGVRVGSDGPVSVTDGSSARSRAWTVGLLNVCVANMAPVAGDGGIAALFQRGKQDEGEAEEDGQTTLQATAYPDDDDDGEMDGWNDGGHAGTEGDRCQQCGQFLPVFAQEAHARFHLLGD